MPHAIQVPDITQKHGDWRDNLFQNGYAIIKNAVPASRAAGYVESMTQWLEKFPLGFDRNNPSTWTEEHLPAHMKYASSLFSRSRPRSGPLPIYVSATNNNQRGDVPLLLHFS